MKKQDFKNHSLHQLLTNFEIKLNDFPDAVRQDERYKELIDKYHYLKWCLDKSEPRLLSSRDLDLLAPSIQNATQIANNARANASHLPSVDAQLTEFLKILPYPRMKKIFKSDANEIISEIRNHIEEIEKDFLVRLKELDSKLSEEETATGQLASVLEQIKVASQQEQGKVDAQFSVWEQKLNNVLDQNSLEFDQKFSKLKDEKVEQLDDRLEESRVHYDILRESLLSLKSENSSIIEQTKKEAAAWKAQLESEGEEVLEKIKILYSIVGDTALAGDFIKTADTENTSYIWFSRLAAFLFVLAPSVLVYILFWHNNLSNFELVDILKRLPIAAMFLVPAWYLSSLAQKHRRVEVASRSLGMKVAAFDAYLANLPSETRDALKVEMAAMFFETTISPDKGVTIETSEISGQIVKSIGNVVETVKKIPTGSGK